ncbi:Mif2/CENP-C like-domain-containing protein [Tuber brumale]|nr:Mif2/CENP-C like-domain-containing protein [Tuber brumale]
MKPLEFWKGEKVVYTLTDPTTTTAAAAASTIKLPEIAEIIRVESDEEEKAREWERRKKRSAAAQSAGNKRKRALKQEDAGEEFEEEPWESQVVDGEIGVIRGYVKPFPPIAASDQLEEAELAFSRNRIVTVEVANGDFTFVKTCTQPFFGTGMIEIPPGGIKRTKNSGKMHLVFYLLQGKVQVQVGETTFRVRGGGQFMVPRGNLYSIENPYDVQAKMFFAQGCEIEGEEED